jgi:AraC family transcriptional regulator
MITGVTVAEYIRKRRLTLAAQELATSPVKVVDVALKYGYDSPESFAKAFRKAHGITPTAAREQGVRLKAFPRISFQLSIKGDKEMDYRIVEKESFKVIGKSIEVTCKDGENLRQIPQFWQACHEDGTVGKLAEHGIGSEVLGVCLSMEMEKERFTYAIGVEVHADVNAGDFDSWIVPAATWAEFASVGPMPGAIQKVFERIYQEWFPATGYEHAGGPEIEVYPPGDTNAEDYRCEVRVPIVKK